MLRSFKSLSPLISLYIHSREEYYMVEYTYFFPELHSCVRHLLLLLSGQTVFSTISNALDLTVFFVSLFLTVYTPLNLARDF